MCIKYNPHNTGHILHYIILCVFGYFWDISSKIASRTYVCNTHIHNHGKNNTIYISLFKLNNINCSELLFVIFNSR